MCVGRGGVPQGTQFCFLWRSSKYKSLVKLQKNHICLWLRRLNIRNSHIFLWNMLFYQKGITSQKQTLLRALGFERKTSRGKTKNAKGTATVPFQKLEQEAFGFFPFKFSCRSWGKTAKSRNGDNRLGLRFWEGRWKRNFSSGVIIKLLGFKIPSCQGIQFGLLLVFLSVLSPSP